MHISLKSGRSDALADASEKLIAPARTDSQGYKWQQREGYSSKPAHGLSAFLCQSLFSKQHLAEKNKAQTNQPPDEIAKAACSSPEKQSRSLVMASAEERLACSAPT